MVNIARPSSVEPVSTRSSNWSSAARPFDLVEGHRGAEGVEREEADGQHDHDKDHAPAHRLAQRVAGHYQRAAHAAPPPRGRRPRASRRAAARRTPARRSTPARRRSSAPPRASPRGSSARRRRSPPPPRAAAPARPACRATIRPPSRIATRSHTSSTSLRRCELSTTATSRLAQLPQKVAHHAPAHWVERAGGLVQHQQPGRAHQRLRDSEPLLHALRHGGDLHVAGVREPDQLQQLRPLVGAAPEPARSWWSAISSSAVSHSGKRNSSAR